MQVKHVPEYRRTDSEGSIVVLDPTEELVKVVIFYRALVKVVELGADGRMAQGDASALSKGGWSFKIDPSESVRAIAEASVLRRRCESRLTLRPNSDSMLVIESES